jgi:hypothetical protein
MRELLMIEYPKPITKDNVRDDLSLEYQDREQVIMFNGERLGKLVSFGKHVGLSRAKTKTAYASRIYRDGLRIEVEASSGSGVLDKVAVELARELKRRKSAGLEAGAEEQAPTEPKL